MPRFLCDAMLGSLARWLRFFGLDCAYCDVSMDDSAVAYRAELESRWLLSRDRELVSTGPPRSVLIRSERLEDQVVEVLRRFELRPLPTLAASRCAACNGVLEEVTREAAAPLVPPFVARTAARFRRCTSCGRLYWPGTHGIRIERRMAEMRRRLDQDPASAIMSR